MAEIVTKNVLWSSIYHVYNLKKFLQDIRYSMIKSTQIDLEKQQTDITFDTTYHSQDMDITFNLIPDKVVIEKNKSISFNKLQTFDLINFPQLLKFIENHCQYIFDFIIDKKIESVTLLVTKFVRYSDDTDTLSYKLEEFQQMKTLLKNQNIELQAFVFAALIKNFYQQNSEPLTISETPQFRQINSYAGQINALLNMNIDTLINYHIKRYTDPCISGDSFKFLNNNILQINNFNMYEQNLDLKFLSFISQQNLENKL